MIKQSFSVVLGQCSPNVRDRLESHPSYSQLQTNLDVIGLLKRIRESLYVVGTSKHPVHTATEAAEAIYGFYQGYHVTNHAILTSSRSMLSAFAILVESWGKTQPLSIRSFMVMLVTQQTQPLLRGELLS